MDFVIAIITPIVQSLIEPVKRELGLLFSSSDKVRSMHARVKELDGAGMDMRTRVQSRVGDRLAVPHHVPNWLEEVKVIHEMAQKIPVDQVGCFNLKTRYKKAKKSCRIVRDIDRLMKEKDAMVWLDERRPLSEVIPQRPSISAAVDEDEHNENIIESRHLILNKALKSLEPNNIKTQMTALYGMAGVGKTTMMEEIEKAANDRSMFDHIVKVVVGQNPNMQAVQKTVAEQIGLDLTETTNEARVKSLKNKFESMSEQGKKKILVILDDVWVVFNLKDIGLTNPLKNGFKLLLTSREETACTNMGVVPSSLFKIEVLHDPEDKKLFWDTVGKVPDTESDLHKIGEDILKRCGGLPIAIKTIASTLRNIQNKHEWEHALFCIRNQEFTTFRIQGQDNLVLINIFEYSYKNLEDDLKATFLLCGLFPDDSNIFIEDLVMYGWGLKFFRNVHHIAVARSRVNTYVDKLIRSNLLIKSNREGCVKMHDLVRDFILSSFSKVKQASIVDHNNNVSEKLKEGESYERILLNCKGMVEFPVDFYYPNLTLLKLMDGNELLKLPKDFYTRMEKLEVVAYKNMHPLLLPQYPANLRALCLHSCTLVENDISPLGDLVSLEVLSLVNCGINKLPSKIGNLQRLKLLNLNGCFDLCIDAGVFQRLGKLEELYMSVSEYCSIRFTDGNCDELNMLSRKLSALEFEFFKNKAQPTDFSFENLERFRISLGCRLRNERSDKYQFKNTLKLVTNTTELHNCKINKLFRKTEILHLDVNDMSDLKEVLSHPPQESFCNLKALTISDCASLSCLFTLSVAKSLMRLESLVIRSCDVLKELWSSEIASSEEEVNNIFMLRKINIQDCNSIVNLFPSNPMRLLSNLEELIVGACASIEVLFNIDLGKIEQLSRSNLRDVKVLWCQSFRDLWRVKDARNNYFFGGFQAVENIYIEKCERFRNIVSPTTANFDMRAVKDICILGSRYFKRFSTRYDSSPEQEINTVSKEEISIVGDSMSFVPFTSYLNFHQLKKIKIETFHGVNVMFEMESLSNGDQVVTIQQPPPLPLPLLPFLEHLYLENMNNLNHVWKCNNWNECLILHKRQPQSSFQNLRTVNLHKCKNIKYLFTPLTLNLLSNLKEISISKCNAMEEVVYSNRVDHDEEMMTTTFSRNLDILLLSDMKILKHIGGGVANDTTNVIHGQSKLGVVYNWSLCQFSRRVVIESCDALSSLFPSYAIGHMQEVQELTISSCNSMMDVFETTIPNPRPLESTTHKLTNLKKLEIGHCDCLEYVFTFSILESLNKLEELEIHNCKGMKVIVKEEEHEVQTMLSSKNMEVVFPELKSIKLINLPNLAGFFFGMNIGFQWPILDHVTIYNCPQMIVFTSGRSTSPKLKCVYSERGTHNLECGLNVTPTIHQTPSSSLDTISSRHTISDGIPWSFHSLITCNVEYTNLQKIFPSNKLQQLQNLESIHASQCREVEEVFEVVLEVSNNEPQTLVKFPKLRIVHLEYMDNLKYIWKSNHSRILEFSNLKTLTIHNCSSLEHVFTCSMVGCVMNLEELRITLCKNMEVIIKKEEEECDAKVTEIIEFPCLKLLHLGGLTKLKGFCLGKVDFTFPALDKFLINGCPEYINFTKGCSVAPKIGDEFALLLEKTSIHPSEYLSI